MMKGTESPAPGSTCQILFKIRMINELAYRLAILSDFGCYLWTGSQLESGPTTPLPDKTLLVFILDRLQKWVGFLLHMLWQSFISLRTIFLSDIVAYSLSFLLVWLLCRKDTYGVFSEAVDPDEVIGDLFLCIQMITLYVLIAWWVVCFFAAAWLLWDYRTANGFWHCQEKTWQRHLQKRGRIGG